VVSVDFILINNLNNLDSLINSYVNTPEINRRIESLVEVIKPDLAQIATLSHDGVFLGSLPPMREVFKDIENKKETIGSDFSIWSLLAGFFGWKSTTYTKLTELSELMKPALLSLALEMHDIHTIKALHESGYFKSEDTPLTHRIQALELSLRVGHLLTAWELLEYGPISVEDRSQFVRSAAQNGRLDIMQMLLDNGPISQRARDRALEEAARNGHVAVVRALLDQGAFIHPYHKSLAFSHAAQNGHLAVIHALVESGPISIEDRGLTVEDAAQNGHLAIVQALLESGPISLEDRGAAIDKAFHNGYLAVAYWLLGAPHPEGVVDQAALQVDNVHHGQRDLFTHDAIFRLYDSQTPGPTQTEIETYYQQFIAYINTQPEDRKNLALLALNAPKKPAAYFGPLVSEESFTYLGHPIKGKELVARLWYFASHLADPKEQINAKEGMVSALVDSWEEEQVVCNQGKTQRLIVACVQGRMAGINIEQQDFGTLTKAEAMNMFFAITAHRTIDNFTSLQAAANKFCDENPSVAKEAFLVEINKYAKSTGFE